MNKEKKAQKILEDEGKLSIFAALNHLTIAAAQTLLQRLLEKPESSEEFERYNFAAERSEDFQAYRSGLNDGKKNGNEEGLGKGLALGLMIGAAATTYVWHKVVK